MGKWAILIVMIMVGVSVNAQPVLQEHAIGHCTASSLQIRSKPSLDSDIIGSITLNEEVLVYGRGSNH